MAFGAAMAGPKKGKVNSKTRVVGSSFLLKCMAVSWQRGTEYGGLVVLGGARGFWVMGTF